jgi:pimeloyl-ACP methyl ester carboxylesterase
MVEYLRLSTVKTWYDEHGSGDPLVLLHGGLVDARSFDPNLGALAERFHAYTPERHGHTPMCPGLSPRLIRDADDGGLGRD